MIAILAVFSYQAQDPLWSSGGSSVAFNSMSLSFNDYPVPSTISGFTDPLLYYSAPTSIQASQAQYGADGELLFYIVNGSIYNKDGYLIADASDEFVGNYDCLVCIGSDNYEITPEIIISPVPNLDSEENCYLFYVFMTYTEPTTNSQYKVHTSAVLVDVSAENDLFSNADPEVNGDLVTSSQVSSYSGYFTSFFSSNSGTDFHSSRETLVYTSLPKGVERGYHRLELLDNNAYTDKTLIVNDEGAYRTIDVDDQGSFSLTTQSVYGGTTSSKVSIAGECEVTYSSTLGTYLLATLKPYFNQHPRIYLSHINSDGSLVPGQEVLLAYILNPIPGLPSPVPEPVAVFGIEFSDNGRYLYINVGYGSQYATGRLFCYDVENLTWVTLSINWNQYSARKYHLSQIEGQVYNGTSGIYIPGDSGLGVLSDADDAPNAVYSFNAYATTASLDYSVFDNYDGTNADIRYLSKQNFNGTTIQSFLAQANCCEEGVEASGYGDQSFDGTATWEDGDNPFSDGTSPILIHGTLTFESGSDIDIEDMTFEFGPDGKIVVEAGGRIDLDGTTLTSTCYKMWPGVIIEGTSGVDQLPETGGDQGKIYMHASAVIENAEIGVDIKAGGILKAYNSTFRNNRVGVYMNPYALGSLNNKSTFYNCLWVTDSPMLEGIPNPRTHLDLQQVYGVLVWNCSFMNTVAFQAMSINKRGTGINAFNSQFTVKGNNDPYSGTTDPIHDTFYRLTNGINATNTDTRVCDIHNVEFQENRSGIWITETEGPRVVFNNFDIPENVYVNGEFNRVPEGMYLLESSGFTVEENEFSFNDMDNGRTTGLIIDESSEYPGSVPLDNVENEVFRNRFTNLETGIRVRNDNRGSNGQHGLVSRCEYFSNCVHDVLLEPHSEWRDYQGLNTGFAEDLTNNKFTYSLPNCTNFHDHNVSTTYGSSPLYNLQFTYYALTTESTWPTCVQDNNSYSRITPFTPPALINDNFDYDLHCITSYPGGVVKSKGESGLIKNNDDLILDYLSLQQSYTAVKEEYDSGVELGSADEELLQESLNLSGELGQLEREIIDVLLLTDTIEDGSLEDPDLETYLSFLASSTNPRHHMLLARHAMQDGADAGASSLSAMELLSEEEAAWWSQRTALESMESLDEATEAELWYRYEQAEDGSSGEALAYLHGHGYAHVMPTWDDEEDHHKRLSLSEVKDQLIKLSPNPAEDMLNVQYLGDSEEQLIIDIHNAQGSRVGTYTMSPRAGVRLDLSSYSAGMYHLTLRDDLEILEHIKFTKR